MLKQILQQKLQHKLSPAQIQTVKLMEITTLELEERVRQELEENPALEEDYDSVSESTIVDTFGENTETPDMDKENDIEIELNDPGENADNDNEKEKFNSDDYDFGDYDSMDDDIPEYRLRTNNHDLDSKHEDIPFTTGISFNEYLEEQVGYLELPDHEKNLVHYIIGNIDQEGYLRRLPDVMVDDLMFQTGIITNEEVMLRLIKMVQTFEPAGVGATSLQECLLLQLERKQQTKPVLIAVEVITQHFDAFSKRHFDKIQHLLELSDEMMKNVITEITRLNPKPGSAWGGDLLEHTKSTIIPEFTLENNNGKLTVHLNQNNVPELRINATFRDMLKDFNSNKKNQTREMKDAIMFVKQKMDSAQWFIDAVKQRQQTLLVTMTAIVDFQKEFFIEGHESFLKPMILKDIADMTGYDVSTISRVSNSKYIQTEYAIYPVKYFFSEAIKNGNGDDISTREIKTCLQDCIDNEDKRDPLSDDELAEYLKEKGYPIARRTVAKYRNLLGVPVARLRVEF